MADALKILITGDFCPIRRVEALSREGAYDRIFKDVLPLIRQADIAVTNLECPLIEDGQAADKIGPALKGSVQAVDGLKYAGFNLVTLANNHIMDYGEPGLASTIQACEKNGINHVGCGQDLQHARQIFHKNINGRRLAFLNFAENEFSTTWGDKAGANPLNPIWNYYDIQEARQNADVVFVIVHGGQEHYRLPSPEAKSRYRFFVDAGAHAVVAHHTHCYSGYEVYKHAPILYGVGNFVFDDPRRRNGLWNAGMIAEFDLVGETLRFNLTGTIQCDNDTVGVRLMRSDERDNFDREIRRLSDIITDDQSLERAWRNMIADKKQIFQAMALIGNGYLRKAIHKKIIPISLVTNPTQRKLVLNVLRCESLREVAIQALEWD